MTTPFPQLTSLSQVTPDSYKQAEVYIMALLAASFPDRDFGYGKALYWHVVVPAATSMAAVQTNAELMGSSLSIKWIRDNPTLVNEELAAAILSNYYQILGAGASAVGTVAVVVSKAVPYAIAEGTEFTANGITYLSTTDIFAQVTAAEIRTTADRLLTPRSDGSFQFLVPVASELVGVGTFSPRGTVLTTPNPPSNFLQAVAASDISGGTDAQTVASIAATLPQSFAAQVFGDRSHVAAMLGAAFPGTRTAQLGMGDPEQWRDTHNLMQIQTGGMVDLYVATQSSVGTNALEVTATLRDAAARTWEIALPRDIAAGVYAVVSVLPPGDTRVSMPILATTRSISIPVTGYRPLIDTPAEAAFSAYQALLVSFTDTYGDHTGLIAGDTRTYAIAVLAMPLVQEINDYMVNGRLTKADNVLVRGAVPCVTRIAMQIRLLDSDSLTDTDVANIKQAIVARVGSIGFGYGVLSASIVMDAAHNYLSGRSDVGANTVTLRGDIYAPTGELMILDGQEIRIPNEPTKMVTKNNTVFLTDISRVDIALLPVETP